MGARTLRARHMRDHSTPGPNHDAAGQIPLPHASMIADTKQLRTYRQTYDGVGALCPGNRRRDIPLITKPTTNNETSEERHA